MKQFVFIFQFIYYLWYWTTLYYESNHWFPPTDA